MRMTKTDRSARALRREGIVMGALMRNKRHARIKHWDDERAIGNSLIVTLIEGFAFYPHADERVAEHVHGFDTVEEAMQRVRTSYPCSCDRCTQDDAAKEIDRTIDDAPPHVQDNLGALDAEGSDG